MSIMDSRYKKIRLMLFTTGKNCKIQATFDHNPSVVVDGSAVVVVVLFEPFSPQCQVAMSSSLGVERLFDRQ